LIPTAARLADQALAQGQPGGLGAVGDRKLAQDVGGRNEHAELWYVGDDAWQLAQLQGSERLGEGGVRHSSGAGLESPADQDKRTVGRGSGDVFGDQPALTHAGVAAEQATLTPPPASAAQLSRDREIVNPPDERNRAGPLARGLKYRRAGHVVRTFCTRPASR
jgi:hypothetical protein